VKTYWTEDGEVGYLQTAICEALRTAWMLALSDRGHHGLSRNRVHKLLQEHDVSAILTWLSHLRNPMFPPTGEATGAESALQHIL